MRAAGAAALVSFGAERIPVAPAGTVS
jgi:hypothetical protein